jgi:cell division septation protein DedD
MPRYSLTTMAMLVWACLVLGVSSSRSAAGGGLAKQQEATSVVDESYAASLRRGLQWWKDPQGGGGNDKKGDDDDDDKNDDKDDDNKDDDEKCAGRDDRSRECGASDSFPKKCCGSLICEKDGIRCKAKEDVEEDDDDDEPKCSILGMRSQQCGGGGALPAACCGDLVCNENNRCDDPANAGNAKDDAPATDGGEEGGDLATCASDGDRAVECGATNPSRPTKCCPGHICSNDAGFASCVRDPSSGATPGGVPVTPDAPLSPAQTPSKMTGEPTMISPTSEPTLEPSLEPTKERSGLLATSGATAVAGGAVVAWVSVCAGALYALF